jgi:hypothetical protein
VNYLLAVYAIGYIVCFIVLLRSWERFIEDAVDLIGTAVMAAGLSFAWPIGLIGLLVIMPFRK